jgi:hypothetical protein
MAFLHFVFAYLVLLLLAFSSRGLTPWNALAFALALAVSFACGTLLSLAPTRQTTFFEPPLRQTIAMVLGWLLLAAFVTAFGGVTAFALASDCIGLMCTSPGVTLKPIA